MTESESDRFIRAEQTVTDLIEKLPKELLGQIARMLAQNIATIYPKETYFLLFFYPKNQPFTPIKNKAHY